MNSHSAAASAYKESAFENAPPIKVVRMMYAGALKFIEQAEGIDPKADASAFTQKINRIDAIVSELRLALVHDHAPELCQNLTVLYLFVEGQLREAIMQQSHEPLKEAREVLATLSSGWQEIEVD